eukprot:TRINITY_DN71067_c0_g1_i1.p1 TRINITY_DN71067_c0_g1~~TRINITY_DN71067_c0_g1_i1.p1  ORF type:complete len:488 (+),score=47.02 TRINITY_DN71067_c0_g1_i1:38-1501(+)
MMPHQAVYKLSFTVISLVSATVGTIISFQLQHDVGLNAVMASAITGVISHSLPSPYRELMFAGSFGGMSNHTRNEGPFTLPWVTLAGLLTGLVALLLQARFNGAGGKLGTCAFLGSTVAAGLARALDANGWTPYAGYTAGFDAWNVRAFIVAPIAAAAGAACTTFLLHKPTPTASPTLASSTVGLAASLFFRWAPLLVAFAYAGSFAGMSSSKRLSPGRVVVAGLVTGLVLLAVWPLFPGVGGKWGVSALVAVLTTELVAKLVARPSEPTLGALASEITSSKSADNVVVQPASVGSTSTASAIVSEHLQIFRSRDKPESRRPKDWVDWIPARTWQAVGRFLAQGETFEAANDILTQTYSATDLARDNLRVEVELEPASKMPLIDFLYACCDAESEAARPPPGDIHTSAGADGPSFYALHIFSMVADGSLTLPLTKLAPVLDAFDAIGNGVEDDELTAADFANLIMMRGVRSRSRVLTRTQSDNGFFV